MAAKLHRPSVMADYLYDLSQAYSSFYQNVPFLKAEEGPRASKAMHNLRSKQIVTKERFITQIDANLFSLQGGVRDPADSAITDRSYSFSNGWKKNMCPDAVGSRRWKPHLK